MSHDIGLFLSPAHFIRDGASNYNIEMSFLKGEEAAGSQPREIVEYQLQGDKERVSLKSRKSHHPTTSLIIAYSASRRMSSRPLSESSQRQPGLFNEDEPLLNAEERLLKLLVVLPSKGEEGGDKGNPKLELAKQLLIDFLPDVEELDFRKPDANKDDYQVVFKTPYGWVPTSGLSLGYRTMMAWVLDLALRLYEKHPKVPNPLAEPAVVLVDEIDLHLHPKWQRYLVTKLTETFPNTQFIVTAHSPLLVQSAENAAIAVLRKEGDHVVIDNTPEEIRGWRVDQILTSDLFGLTSSRPPSYDRLMEERIALLEKDDPTDAELDRLEELEAELDRIPYAESRQFRNAMDVIMKAADRIERGGGE